MLLFFVCWVILHAFVLCMLGNVSCICSLCAGLFFYAFVLCMLGNFYAFVLCMLGNFPCFCSLQAGQYWIFSLS